ncbi:Proline-rich receptor-like protein kinase PERK9 [Morus notabilis]|uniref:Proline-rich receptor-like protein kinase PERK9 n=2 Tax=Morus notabilis TaxID=981085 RepID=W9S1X7_9ROSA|nr:serine/threonine receptor-like kinase NFP [Morus notabilis]EXC04576.1 Proline-rich receptor-like protein kinase PERK9 [Morus notabilis]
MKTAKLFLFSFFSFIIYSNAQTAPNTTGYNCTINQTTSPCETYVFYRASAPNFLDLASIGDLFSVSRLMISEPSNISSPSSTLVPNQALFVPITCSCNSVPNDTRTISYANISYTIKEGDTFYLVSTNNFRNLTTYQSVEIVNPTLVPTNLSIGVEAIFPIFCKCPNRTSRLENGQKVNHLVSYVFQLSDNLSTVASTFGVQTKAITDYNGENINPFDTIFIPVSQLPELTQPATAPTPPPSENDDNDGAVIGLAVGLGITAVLLVLVGGVLLYRERLMRKRRALWGDVEKEKGQFGMKGKSNSYNNKVAKEMEETLMADVSGCLDKYRVFGVDELEESTNGFHENCLIQGSVYKGTIDGEVFAIKKMNWNACEELKILQKVNHGNLVKLEGFCIDPSNANCYLIYEYVENGSLYSWLHENENGKLSWKTRLRIAVDVANGLQYIHEHTRPRVVHKDIKSSNILLDTNMRAKIANFGLAKSGFNAITMHIVGTQGYIAPEYLTDGMVSTKMDVFSFGVVLLELISGKEVIDEEGNVLWAGAGRVLEGNEEEKVKKLKDWMDHNFLEESYSMDSMMGVMAVAVACLHRDPSKRPSMVDIVYALCKSDDLFYDISDDTLSGSQVIAR